MKKTGFIQPQSNLKVDVYNLFCVPYSVSPRSCSLLVALSRDEVIFFQRFKGGLAGLNMAFQTPFSIEPLKLFARCSLNAISPIKGRENAALIQAEFKPCPQDLVRILEEFRSSLVQARSLYDCVDTALIRIDPAAARDMGYNNYAVLTSNGTGLKMALYAVSCNFAEILLPMGSPDLKPGSPVSMKLYFRKYQFSVSATVQSSGRQASAVQKVSLKLDFSPELIELIEDYRHLLRVNARKAGQSA